MKNKKGFAFMETVIILMVVTLSLTLLLSTYALISRKSKEKENYDKASDKYLLYSVMNLGTNARYNYKSMLDENYILGPKITPNNCSEYDVLRNIYNDSELSLSSETNCKKIYESMDIIALYLVKDINQALSSPEATSHFDNGTINYLKTLKKCNDEDNKYIKDGMVINTSEYVCDKPINYLVGVFYRNDEYYFASLVLGDEKLSSNKGTYTVKINYLYAEDKSVAADSYQIELKDIERYNVKSPTIKGYTPDKEVVSGFINGGNMTINVMYVANNYTLTLDQQPGSGGTSSVTATYNKTLPDIAIPSRTGYTFNGYYSEVNGKGTQYYNADGKSSIEKYTMASDITLHAHWELDSTKYNCTYDGDLIQGAEYVNGQYTYRYMQDGAYSSDYTNIWKNNTSIDGWGVQLTNKESTEPVTSELCSSINGKPIASMSYMFAGSQAKTLDLSSFNTSKVTNMRSMFNFSQATTLDLSNFDTSDVTSMYDMFEGSQATTIEGLKKFNTSNVTNMSSMFRDSKVTELDLSSFNTSNVTNMNSMFSCSQAISLDLSNFDTSNVTNMSGMFERSQAITIEGLKKFNTSNVTNMSWMFSESKARTLDLSSFDTSNVTDMSHMFYKSKATTLDLSSFDTSNVTNMSVMFYYSQATTLDLSSFDTSNVTDMSNMFHLSRAITLNLTSFNTSNVTDMSSMFSELKATTLDLSSFDTSNVTNMKAMFSFSKVTTLDLSSFDTSNVTDMSSMFSSSQATKGYARTQADADKFNSSSSKPDGLKFVVK